MSSPAINNKKDYIVSAQTLVYIYNQRQVIVFLEIGANANRRYQAVYAKDLIINRGIDNLLEFSFINQEQKPVDITGKTITFRLINSTGKTLILQKSLDPIYALTGIAGLRVTKEELLSIDSQLCYYSLEISNDPWSYPVFVDSAGGARGIIRITDSVLPMFVESAEITIPSHVIVTGSNSPLHYNSSVYYNRESDFNTFQMMFSNFTGSIQFQGSTLEDFSLYYNIDSSQSYVNFSGNDYKNIIGFHPFIRISITNIGTQLIAGTYIGDLDTILVR